MRYSDIITQGCTGTEVTDKFGCLQVPKLVSILKKNPLPVQNSCPIFLVPLLEGKFMFYPPLPYF